MDLTNIKPCVECPHFDECAKWYNAEQMTMLRMRDILFNGDDCFKEWVDDER